MSTDMDDVRQRIEAEKEITQRFFEVVAAYVIEGAPGDAPPYLPPEPWGTVSSTFRDAMEFFIMGRGFSPHPAPAHRPGREDGGTAGWGPG